MSLILYTSSSVKPSWVYPHFFWPASPFPHLQGHFLCLSLHHFSPGTAIVWLKTQPLLLFSSCCCRCYLSKSQNWSWHHSSWKHPLQLRMLTWSASDSPACMQGTTQLDNSHSGHQPSLTHLGSFIVSCSLISLLTWPLLVWKGPYLLLPSALLHWTNV